MKRLINCLLISLSMLVCVDLTTRNFSIASASSFGEATAQKVTKPVISDNWIIGIVFALVVIILEVVILVFNLRKLKKQQKNNDIKTSSFIPYSFISLFSLYGAMGILLVEIIAIFVLFKINLSVYKKLK